MMRLVKAIRPGTKQAPLIQVGNRCGFDLHNPPFDCIQPLAAANQDDLDVYGKLFRPLILRELALRMKELYTNPMKHMSWCFRLVDDKVKRWGANVEKKRAEFRAAMAQVMSTLVINMDLLTMRVGYYDDQGAFHYYTRDWLAAQAGVSLSRLTDVFTWMRKEGILLGSTEDGKKGRCYTIDAQGNYHGKANPKVLSKHLFAYFGMDDWLKTQREAAAQRAAERREAASEQRGKQQTAVDSMRSAKMLSDLQEMVSAKRSSSPAATPADYEAAREIARKAIEEIKISLA